MSNMSKRESILVSIEELGYQAKQLCENKRWDEAEVLADEIADLKEEWKKSSPGYIAILELPTHEDSPAKVIEFPGETYFLVLDEEGRRVRPLECVNLNALTHYQIENMAVKDFLEWLELSVLDHSWNKRVATVGLKTWLFCQVVTDGGKKYWSRKYRHTLPDKRPARWALVKKENKRGYMLIPYTY